MIRNIIFDMGGVLIRWDPLGFVRELGRSEEEGAMLLANTYRSPLWAEMDWGRAVEEDVFAAARQNLPEYLHDDAWKLICHWFDRVQPIPGMEALVRRLKKQGRVIYLLSNASFRQKDYWPKVPANEIFDGRIVSAEVGVVKPHRQVFEILLERYHLRADECVFIDDMWENVLGAMNAGLHGVVFDGDAERLENLLEWMM